MLYNLDFFKMRARVQTGPVVLRFCFGNIQWRLQSNEMMHTFWDIQNMTLRTFSPAELMITKSASACKQAVLDSFKDSSAVFNV